MSLARLSLLALCITLAATGVPGNASAQDDKPFDLKPLIPPILPPLPPNSQVTSGSLTATPMPGTANTPSPQAPTQSAPGFRFSIPTTR
jgi:hypothetical protein